MHKLLFINIPFNTYQFHLLKSQHMQWA